MKKVTLIFFLMFLFHDAKSQNMNTSTSNVSGVVTYFFNNYQGNKADIGASVTFIDSSNTKGFDFKTYENYHYGNSYRKMYQSTLERYENYNLAFKRTEGKKKLTEDNAKFRKGMEDALRDNERHMKELVIFNSETDEKFSKNATELYMQLLKLDEDLPSKTVDANGNYTLNIKPGTYYVLIKSKNRTSLSLPEMSGKIYVKKIKVAEGAQKDVSYNFEL